jgi:2-polyprenyl-3-methyl-5-hydroxy-6-metoxy-1,4-benzoquinol methylase
MHFIYHCVVNGEEEDDYSWITLNEMLEHLDEEQFVGCLYELLATHIGRGR